MLILSYGENIRKTCRSDGAGIGGLFFARALADYFECVTVLERDLAYPDTRGELPPNLKQSLIFGAAFMELAARDASVHKLMWEIRSLLKPYSALTNDPALMQRIQALMIERTMQKPEMALAAQG